MFSFFQAPLVYDAQLIKPKEHVRCERQALTKLGHWEIGRSLLVVGGSRIRLAHSGAEGTARS